jgi:hypothetical protein
MSWILTTFTGLMVALFILSIVNIATLYTFRETYTEEAFRYYIVLNILGLIVTGYMSYILIFGI